MIDFRPRPPDPIDQLLTLMTGREAVTTYQADVPGGQVAAGIVSNKALSPSRELIVAFDGPTLRFPTADEIVAAQAIFPRYEFKNFDSPCKAKNCVHFVATLRSAGTGAPQFEEPPVRFEPFNNPVLKTLEVFGFVNARSWVAHVDDGQVMVLTADSKVEGKHRVSITVEADRAPRPKEIAAMRGLFPGVTLQRRASAGSAKVNTLDFTYSTEPPTRTDEEVVRHLLQRRGPIWLGAMIDAMGFGGAKQTTGAS